MKIVNLNDAIENLFHSTISVLFALLFTGCVLLLTFLIKKSNKHIGLLNGLYIGLAQALAIVPGISRSGMTISTALFMGVEREESGEFSFLLSIPVIMGASVMALKDSIGAGFTTYPWDVAIIGVIASFISGWISLVFLMKIVRHGDIGYFGFYCVIVSLAGMIF